MELAEFLAFERFSLCPFGGLFYRHVVPLSRCGIVQTHVTELVRPPRYKSDLRGFLASTGCELICPFVGFVSSAPVRFLGFTYPFVSFVSLVPAHFSRITF